MDNVQYIPYSARRKESQDRVKGVDLLEFENFPQRFLHQACFCITDAVGYYHPLYDMDLPRYFNWVGQPLSNEIWFRCLERADREFGNFVDRGREYDPQEEYLQMVLNAETADDIITIIEIAFYEAQNMIIDPGYELLHLVQAHKGTPDVAAKDLNQRFKQHRLGYRLELNGPRVEIIRLDDEFIHSELTLPALDVLARNGFEGARHEFEEAFSFLVKGDYKASMNECLKSFESTMKSICKVNGWPYESNAAAGKLLEVMKTNRLFPVQLEDYSNNLLQILKSGVPTLRNKRSGHGQGPEIDYVPESLARFTFNLTASNIVFLASQVNESHIAEKK